MNYDNSDSREISLKSQYGLEKAPNVTKDAMILQVLDNINTATVEKNNNGRYSGIIIRDRENTTSSGLIKPVVFGDLPEITIDLNKKVYWDLSKEIQNLNQWIDEINGDDSDYVPFKAFNIFYNRIIDLLGIIQEDLNDDNTTTP